MKGRQVDHKMRVERFLTGIISTNCYLAVNEETKQTVVIDPAASSPNLMNHIEAEGLKIEAILLTHGHFDHIMGIDGFLKKYKVPVYVHEADRELMNDPKLNQSSSYTAGYTFSGAEYIQDGHAGVLLFLCEAKGRIIQRRYVVRQFCGTHRLSGEQYVGAGPLDLREADDASG